MKRSPSPTRWISCTPACYDTLRYPPDRDQNSPMARPSTRSKTLQPRLRPRWRHRTFPLRMYANSSETDMLTQPVCKNLCRSSKSGKTLARCARRLECRWRERTRKLRCSTAEPQHPADAQGSEFLAEIDDAVMKNLRADDIRFYGTATVQNQQPDEKTQSVRRQRRRSKEDTKLSLDYLLKTYESHNRSHLAIIAPS